MEWKDPPREGFTVETGADGQKAPMTIDVPFDMRKLSPGLWALARRVR